LVNPATPACYARSLHDALPISAKSEQGFNSSAMTVADSLGNAGATAIGGVIFAMAATGLGFISVFGFSMILILILIVISPRTKRSEEHTSELQSRENIVCRRLL